MSSRALHRGPARRRDNGPPKGPRLILAAQFLLSIPLGSGPPTAAEVDSSLPKLVSIPSSAQFSKNAAEVSRVSQAAGVGIESSAQSSVALGRPPPGQDAAPPAAAVAPPSTSDVNDGDIQINVRLRGNTFRHITSRGARSSPVFREAVLRERVLDGRVMFASNKEYPSGIFSVIRYDSAAESLANRNRINAATRLLTDGVPDDDSAPSYMHWKGRSHARLLRPDHVASAVGAPGADSAGAQSEYSGGSQPASAGDRRGYDPNALDDPSLESGAQGMRYDREGYVMSILGYKPQRLVREEMNQRFAQANPWLDFGGGQSLTLTKIRTLKRKAIEIWWGKGWEMSTVALGIVSFERLVFRRLVNKGNRKVAMAACLLLAFKMNEAREQGDINQQITSKDVLAELVAKFGVLKKEILAAEFPVFVHLGFGLDVPPHLVSPHLERILAAKGTSPAEYLGAALHRRYALMSAGSLDNARALADQYSGDMVQEDRAVLVALGVD